MAKERTEISQGQALRAKAAAQRPFKQALENCDRVTCQFSMIHEHCGDQPKQASFAFSRQIETVGERVFPHEMLVTEEWQPIDFGQLDGKVGFLVIQSLVGKRLQVNPTDEERALWARQIIRVRHVGQEFGWIIREARGMAVELDVGDLEIRVGEGEVKVLITAFPR